MTPTPKTPAFYLAERERVLRLLEGTAQGPWSTGKRKPYAVFSAEHEYSIASVSHFSPFEYGGYAQPSGPYDAALIAAAPALARAYADLCGQMAEVLEAQRWIPVEERLPEEGVDVLGWQGVGIQLVCCVDSEWWGTYPPYVVDVTHWMPLPAPPAQASAGGE